MITATDLHYLTLWVRESRVAGAVTRSRAWRFAGTVAHTFRFLWCVRAAMPWPVRVILAAAMVIKCMPLDFGADETLTLIAAVILHFTRPGLMKACIRAAQLRD
jgi:hypothetical protein